MLSIMTIPRLIIGLGNPGTRYDGTPHNIGFDVVDALAVALRAAPFAPKERFKALLTDVRLDGGHTVTLMKPTTYMNLSGEAVAAWRARNGGEPPEMLVICDDVNIELGQIRLRPSGSDGGQKGLRSVIEYMGSQQVPRLRLGIRPMGVEKIPNLTEFVLHKWWGTAREVAAAAAELGTDCAMELIRSGNFARTMSLYNPRKVELDKP